MLASAETVHIVAEALKHHKVSISVVDPVSGSTAAVAGLRLTASRSWSQPQVLNSSPTTPSKH